VLLTGLTTPLSGSYNISFDNGPSETLSARSSFNLSSSTVLFFRTGLDPDVEHRLDIVNAGSYTNGEGSLLIVGSVNVTAVTNNSGSVFSIATSYACKTHVLLRTQPVPTMSSHTLHPGTIAGLAVGVSLGVMAFTAIVVLYVGHRRRARQRKQNFIVNPRVSDRRLSFLHRARGAPQPDLEKDHHKVDPSGDAPILNITGRKDDDDEEEEDVTERSMLQAPERDALRQARHGSQNSDGSYSIDLPELPGQSHVRTRSDESPTSPLQHASQSFTAAQASPSHFTAVSYPSVPRSPKPRGPREMRSSTFTPQGILLKDIRTPALDIPIDVSASSGGPNSSILSPLPQPTISPLRVNFENDAFERESKAERRSRAKSSVSGISLPASLRQAIAWAQHKSPDISSQSTVPDPDTRVYARHSFLDMDSSTSQSLSSGSHSTRHSASTSTRASTHSRRPAEASQSGGSSGRSRNDMLGSSDDDRRISHGLDMTVAGGPTPSRPSLSPNISFRTVPLPPLTLPQPVSAAEDVPQSVHPTDLAELHLYSSPTESVPHTVSEIHFRHSTQSSRVPTPDYGTLQRPNASPRATHPSLPTPPVLTPAELDTRPYIVQKLVGSPSAGPEPPTPYGSSRMSGPGPSGPRPNTPRSQTAASSFSANVMSRPSTRGS
jgi:hypothetical protein